MFCFIPETKALDYFYPFFGGGGKRFFHYRISLYKACNPVAWPFSTTEPLFEQTWKKIIVSEYTFKYVRTTVGLVDSDMTISMLSPYKQM